MDFYSIYANNLQQQQQKVYIGRLQIRIGNTAIIEEESCHGFVETKKRFPVLIQYNTVSEYLEQRE
jgi:hypothetical protein